MKKITLILIILIAFTSCDNGFIISNMPKERPYPTNQKETKRFHFEKGSKIETYGANWEIVKGQDGHDYLASTSAVMHYVDCQLCLSRITPIKNKTITNYVMLIPDTFKDSRAIWQK